MVEQANNGKKSKMYSDNPISDANRFNFEAYSDAISKIIFDKENKTPFAITINGEWGKGKTTLMKTIKNKLKTESSKEGNRKVRSVWFEAWKYSETDSMLAALIFEIFKEMGKGGMIDKIKAAMVGGKKINVLKEFSDVIRLPTMGLVEIDKWFENQVYKKELAFYDLFQDYMEIILMTFVLKKEKGKFSDEDGVLVIFVDDLDRCPPKQITKVLESINLFFDQEGCFFVFGANISLISNAIEAEYKDIEGFSGVDYIKKMIQLQFDLPAIREKDIMEFMAEELKIEDELKVYFEMITKGLESNQREIKRFLNSLNLMRMLGDSINIEGYEEELLIKWSVLSFSSKGFIKEVNKNHELIIKMEEISGKTKEEKEEFIETLDEPYKELCNIFRYDEKIINVLKYGAKRFKDIDISNYIFLSSVAPKEPGKKGIKIEPGAYLAGADLKERNLSEADLIGANLSEANLKGANLSNANLSSADLSRADLIGTNIRGAALIGTNLRGADLNSADLSSADLDSANLSNANLSNANLSSADLDSADLIEANFSRANLSRANLSRANLSRANLSEAYLSNANLSRAALSRANLSSADLSEAELIGANLSEANLSSANLSRAVLLRANLSRADLSSANLSEAYLSNANLSEANLSKTEFFKAKFDEECLKTILESGNWRDAEFDSDVRKTLEDMSGS